MRTSALFFAASLLAFVVPARALGHAVVTSRQEFKVGAHPVIVVDSSAGGVTVAAGPAGVVRVEANRQADADDQARKLDVELKQDGNTIHVRFKKPSGGWYDNSSVSFEISAPADARLEAKTAGGSVTARGLSGGVEVDTGGGSIEVDGASGAVHLRSGGGGIEARHLDGTVDVSTGGGSVRVEGALRGDNRVYTGGGSIRVSIPASARLAVEASTGGGSASNDFGLPSDGERHSGRFHGSLGDGSSGRLDIRTGGGSIHLGKL